MPEKGVEVGRLIEQGGPFAAALVLLVLGAIALYRYALRPLVADFITITGTLQAAALSAKESAEKSVIAAQESGRAAQRCEMTAERCCETADKLLDRLANEKNRG